VNSFNTLIVEDEFVSIKYLEEMLSEVEFIKIDNVYKARDGQTAYDLIEKHSIDLVFMDINIQGAIDGIECAKRIYNFDKTISIIYTTAYKDSQTILDASETNMIGYLIKPFNTSDVKVVLSMVIKEMKKNQLQNETQKDKSSDKINIGPYYYKPKEKTIYDGLELVRLSKKEREFFYTLYKNKNNFVSIEYLCEYLWSEDKKDQSRSVRELLFRLRKKLPELTIENLPNIGYSLKI